MYPPPTSGLLPCCWPSRAFSCANADRETSRNIVKSPMSFFIASLEDTVSRTFGAFPLFVLSDSRLRHLPKKTGGQRLALPQKQPRLGFEIETARASPRPSLFRSQVWAAF